MVQHPEKHWREATGGLAPLDPGQARGARYKHKISSRKEPTITSHHPVHPLEFISHKISKWVSTSSALLSASAFLLIWLFSGPYLDYSEGWHLLVTTTSAAITFFMIFVLARAQAKDTMAIQIKLNEIIGVLKGANNNLINLENLSETEIANLSKRYEAVADHLHSQTKGQPSVEAIVAHEVAGELEKEAERLGDEADKLKAL